MILALISIFLIGVVSGEISPEANRHLDNLIDENILFEYDEINSGTITNVVDASFIQVKIFQLFDKNCNSKEECGHFNQAVLKSGDSIIELTGPAVLLPYIVPGFQLISEVEAKEFEKMLDLIFPVFFPSGQEIYQENNTWVFIREESFGEKNGVIVKVDDQGKILSINKAEAIERNNFSEENGEVER